MVSTIARAPRAAAPEETLEARRVQLYRRLDDGYQRIEAALDAGRDVTRWEELWFALLAEYEQVCDEFDLELSLGAG